MRMHVSCTYVPQAHKNTHAHTYTCVSRHVRIHSPFPHVYMLSSVIWWQMSPPTHEETHPYTCICVSGHMTRTCKTPSWPCLAFQSGGFNLLRHALSSLCKLILTLGLETRVPSEHGKMNLREGNTPSPPASPANLAPRCLESPKHILLCPSSRSQREQGFFVCLLSINVPSMEFIPLGTDGCTVAK